MEDVLIGIGFICTTALVFILQRQVDKQNDELMKIKENFNKIASKFIDTMKNRS